MSPANDSPTPVHGRLLGVQVGRVQRLQLDDERWEMSGIRKSAAAGRVAVGALGLAGDEQADLSVHGGRSKAVYAYPVEHYEFWQRGQDGQGAARNLPYGSLGENLTISGLLEDSLYVGDVLLFPDCTLRVTQPRSPCHKFIAVMRDPQAAMKMKQSRFSGFYLAVDVPGSLAAGECFELLPGPRQTPLMALFMAGRFRRP